MVVASVTHRMGSRDWRYLRADCELEFAISRSGVFRQRQEIQTPIGVLEQIPRLHTVKRGNSASAQMQARIQSGSVFSNRCRIANLEAAERGMVRMIDAMPGVESLLIPRPGITPI